MSRSRCLGAGLLAVFCALVSGCGQTHQDASEPRGDFSVSIVKASFPAKQAISRATSLRLEIRNTGSRTIPNLAITVNSFGYRSEYPKLAANERPVWIVDQGPGAIPSSTVKTVPFDSPGSDVTATSNTWVAGAVPAGQTRTFVWMVTPVKAGLHTLSYRVAGGLSGKAHAQLSSTQAPIGHFSVNVASQPPITHVDPNTGQLVPGPLPVTP
ncbi:MAG TPA: hypothetical protein VGF15_02560 [Solirubrobacteraceae bacterium]|jgi:hypothetical protein